MNLIRNWPGVQRRYDEYWALENHDRPILFVTAPKDSGALPDAPRRYDSERARWLDFDRVIARNRRRLENTYYAAEAFPSFMPNLGPDIFGAMLGCGLDFGETTSWAEPTVENWRDFCPGDIAQSPWFTLLSQFTDRAVADAKGDYMVGISDLHAGPDALVSLRGPENLCMDLYDCPDDVLPLPTRIWPAMRKVYEDQCARVEKGTTGTTTWMPCYHRKHWYVTSCDFNALISRDMFRKFVLPELLEEAAYFDANLFHLDGPGALRHLDDLLAIPGINGIQWVPGAGAPPQSQWKELLMKIQAAGKCLMLDVRPEEIETLSAFLRPEGVCLTVGCADRDEADALVRLADRLRWQG